MASTLTREELDTRFANALNDIADLIDTSESDIDEMRALLQRIANTATTALEVA